MVALPARDGEGEEPAPAAPLGGVPRGVRDEEATAEGATERRLGVAASFATAATAAAAAAAEEEEAAENDGEDK